MNYKVMPVSLRWLMYSRAYEQRKEGGGSTFIGVKTSEGHNFWETVREQFQIRSFIEYQEHYPYAMKPNSAYPGVYYVITNSQVDINDKELPVIARKTDNLLDHEFDMLYENTKSIEYSYISRMTLGGHITIRIATELEVTTFKLIENRWKKKKA